MASLTYQSSCSVKNYFWQPEPVLKIVLSKPMWIWTEIRQNRLQVTCVFQILLLLNALYGLENGWSQVVISVSPRHSHILHTLLSTGFHLNHNVWKTEQVGWRQLPGQWRIPPWAPPHCSCSAQNCCLAVVLGQPPVEVEVYCKSGSVRQGTTKPGLSLRRLQLPLDLPSSLSWWISPERLLKADI